ncbi:tRNA-binding protein [Roseivirga sp. E12]|uniref:tRNA-binding protein n=1 Tax=Roseivirga sp. E12 TaxID=2819237 RepID=UPI001ABD1D0E|nr:tRNA-binding protein [Roseivirga sp. E12]MBO3699958.1 tRNA-binding protein [Roseivirga sp. E12]
MSTITWQDFEQVSLNIGTIIKAEEYPEARHPAYIIHVDLGPSIGIKKSSAQVTKHYQIDELVGKQVICVTNFPPKQIGKLMSEILITGFPDKNGDVVLSTVDAPVPNGAKLF